MVQCLKEEKMSNLTFIATTELSPDGKILYKIMNTKEEFLGTIEKIRVGAWMSWCLFLNRDCYLSASCLDEVRKKVKELNRTANKG